MRLIPNGLSEKFSSDCFNCGAYNFLFAQFGRDDDVCGIANLFDSKWIVGNGKTITYKHTSTILDCMAKWKYKVISTSCDMLQYTAIAL